MISIGKVRYIILGEACYFASIRMACDIQIKQRFYCLLMTYCKAVFNCCLSMFINSLGKLYPAGWWLRLTVIMWDAVTVHWQAQAVVLLKDLLHGAM